MLSISECNGNKYIMICDNIIIIITKNQIVIYLDKLEKLDPIQSSRFLTYAVENIIGYKLRKRDETSLYGEYIAILYNYNKYYASEKYIIKLFRGNEIDETLSRYYHDYSDSINLDELVARS